jgi:hypothetical protein
LHLIVKLIAVPTIIDNGISSLGKANNKKLSPNLCPKGSQRFRVLCKIFLDIGRTV